MSTVGGCALLATMLVVMNEKAKAPTEVKTDITTQLNIEEKKKPPRPKPVKQERPPPRKTVRPRAPLPQLSSNLDGLGAGVPFFDAGDLGDFGDDLLKGQSGKDLVMTAESVDQQATPDSNIGQPPVPARARAQGLGGHLLVRLVVGREGAVKSVKVLESTLPEWWKDEVLVWIRNARFSPAVYQGEAVQQTVEWPIRFKLS
ncbi:MAG: energy transducer TonB [Myxococcales bacterium]|nr:energy transducer TonB [Myxococcales bacterium]